jgi:hypothetical protein
MEKTWEAGAWSVLLIHTRSTVFVDSQGKRHARAPAAVLELPQSTPAVYATRAVRLATPKTAQRGVGLGWLEAAA